MPWTLVTLDGDRRGRHPLPDGPAIVGSGEAADLRLDHPTVSRRHARLSPDTDGVWLEDLGSSNGTRVDGRAVETRTEVRAGQTLHLGSLECRLEATAVAELEPALEFQDVAVAETGANPETLSVGSIRDFVLESLPGVVACMERLERVGRGDSSDETTPLDVVQAAGAALFASFPLRHLEIVDLGSAGPVSEPESDEAALLFAAGGASPAEAEAEPEDSGDCAEVRAGRLLARIRFTPGFHTGGLLPLVELVLRLAALELPSSEVALRSEGPGLSGTALPEPVSVDPGVRKIYEDARRVARGEVGVLILGESGTGKEVLARFVHACSRRATGELVAINCAALPQDLLELELFGIERGVATGVEARAGRFEQAHGGTLFLDEIGDMTPATQAKILRVLEEGEVYRLGGREPRPARVRVLAATNQDIERMVADGAFRLDLYHRIADCRFTLPPLRQRLVDLPNLAARFLEHACSGLGVRARGISRAALDALLGFDWPGNVRQLEREMARAALFLEDGELLQTRHLHEEIVGAGPRDSAPAGSGLRARLEARERAWIIESLLRNEGNVRAAAQELGLGRTTLYRRLQELEIEL